MIVVAKYISAMVFGGGILGGARKIWGNPYLNSMTLSCLDTAHSGHVVLHLSRGGKNLVVTLVECTFLGGF